MSPDFNHAVKIASQPEQISSDAGALVLREVDHRFGLTAWLADHLHDRRVASLVVHPQSEVVRTMLLLHAQGWSDQADATALRRNPVFRVAVSWPKGRRVVCVVIQKPGELFSRHFYLVTSYSPDDLTAKDLLAAYRKRGTAEGRFGEWMSTVPPSLSSTTRRKKTYRGVLPAKVTDARDPYACNEVQLLLSALAYSLIHIVRCMLNTATDSRWGLRRVFERVLKVGARLRRGQRRLTFVVNDVAAELHALVWSQLASIKPPG